MAKSKSTSASAMRVERQVPGRVPGVLPLVGHRDDVAVQHVEPLGVPDAAAAAAEQRMRLVLLQPAVEVEVVVLLRPEHPGERLAVDAALVLAERARRDALVELVGVGEPLPERRLERRAERRRPPGRSVRRSRTTSAAARGHLEHVARRGLGAGLRRVDRVALAGDDVPVERVLDARRRVRLAPQPLRVALVLREQQLRRAVAGERVLAQLGMGGDDRTARLAQRRLRSPSSPTTRCCGTRASAAGAAGPPPDRGCAP